MLLLLLQCKLHAQQTSNKKSSASALHVGSYCPNVRVHFLNNATPVNLLQCKGKIVVLDFFSHICGACIAGLPKLNALQQTAGDKLQIILVSTDPANELQQFFKTNKIAAANRLPIVAGDKILSALFPHVLVPHDVWIDDAGLVRAITEASLVTQSNVTAMLADKNFTLPLKEDLLDFDASKPLLTDGNGGSSDKIIFRSTLCGYINGIESKTAIYTGNHFKRYLCLNQPLKGLYQEALGGIDANHIVLEMRDSTNFIAHNTPELQQHLYCYELIAPESTSLTDMHTCLVQDVERIFNIKGSFVKQAMPVFALVITDSSKIPLATTEEDSFIQFDNGDSVKIIRHQPLSVMINEMNDASTSSRIIFTDATNFTRAADIKLILHDISNISAINQQLSQYGLALLPREKEIEVFVIKDAASANTLTTISHQNN